MYLYKYLHKEDIDKIIEMIKSQIKKYQLSLINKEGYIKLRNDYNHDKDLIKFFLLICYSFNHQIRFNKKEEFNMPFGTNRSQYNQKIEENLISFCKQLQTKSVQFENNDFKNFNFAKLNKNDFVYADPPYLITTASYK